MFNLNNFPKILNHIKNINEYFEEKSGECITYCPFCDDAEKHRSRKHGHLYISINTPVFNCFLCNTSGSLLKLLNKINFTDEEEINRLKLYAKYNTTKDFFNNIKIKDKDNQKLNNFILEKYEILSKNKKDYKDFNKYLYNRIGCVDFKKFLIYPDYIEPFPNNESKLACCFLNNNNELVNSRFFFDDKIIRYKNFGGLYYFQELNFFNYNNIILTEGPFDIINLYIYNYIFNKYDSFYISVSGKKYLSTIELLTTQYLLLNDNITFHLIFDKDNNKYKYTLNQCNNLIQTLNSNIKIKGWIPIYTKDVGEFISIEEVK